MILERQKGFYFIYIAIQAGLVSISFVLWFFIVDIFYHKKLNGGFSGYINYLVVILVAYLIASIINAKADSPLLMGSAYRRMSVSVRQTFILAVSIVFFTVAIKDQLISRFFLFSYIPAVGVILVLSNTFLPKWLLFSLFNGNSKEKCLILLSGDTNRIEHISSDQKIWQDEIFEWLERQKSYGLQIIGFLGEWIKNEKELKIQHLGNCSIYKDVLQSSKATSLIIIGMPHDTNVLHDIIDVCERLAIRLSVIYDLHRNFGRPVENFQIDGVNMLQFRSEPLQNPVWRTAKRLLDITIALPVVMFILPVVAIFVKMLQLLHARGSLIFKQPRNGRGNSIFQVYKFRTMYAVNHTPAEQAKQGDSRIFKGGGFLRKYSIDELPQFLNVLKGDMSIVGPRPHMPEHNNAWEIHYRPYHVRSMVRPGITGLAQTRGLRGEVCSEEAIKERVRCDIEYIENWSLFFDLGLILKTAFQVVFPPKSAY